MAQLLDRTVAIISAMQGDCHEKSSTVHRSGLDRPCCVGWRAGGAARLLWLLACAGGSPTVRRPDPGDYHGGRTEADVPDLPAAGTGKRSAARGSDARRERKRRANSN